MQQKHLAMILELNFVKNDLFVSTFMYKFLASYLLYFAKALTISKVMDYTSK